jgi:LmbE family N-acetylglucosaminyl deacetylase
MAFRAGLYSQSGGSVKRLSIVFFSGLLIAMLAPRATAQFPPAPGTGPGLAETIEAIDSARVTTRILYVTAHPDDESAAVLTYLARGLHADVALLSLTRGEGGQNALGPEQAPQLGLIRTQELLAATRGYGVKLYFTRAPDFGFSKTPEETEKVWGHQALEDMVRVIRTFRPNIVINHWGGVHSGHGHHQASGLLTPKAVQLAADAAYKLSAVLDALTDFPAAAPWGNEMPVVILDLERGSDNPKGYVLPLDEVSPLYGKTWREIGIDAFTNHHTQGLSGFLNSPFLKRPISLIPEDGGKFDPDTLARTIHTIGGEAEGSGCKAKAVLCPRLKATEDQIADARSAALALDWQRASQLLAGAAENIASQIQLAALNSHQVFDPLANDLADVQRRLESALTLAAGVEIAVQADRGELVPGESFSVTAATRCRREVGCRLSAMELIVPGGKQEISSDSQGGAFHFSVKVSAPAAAPRVLDELSGDPAPLAYVRQSMAIGSYKFYARQPVTFIHSTSTQVDRVPLRIVPAYTLSVEPKQAIEVLSRKRIPFDVLLKVHSYATQPGKVSVGLDMPQGWRSTPPVAIAFSGAGDQYVKLTVTPPDKLAPGNYMIAAYAARDSEKFHTSLEPLPSMPTQLWEEPALCVVHAFEINVPENLRVGYITAEGEPIPEALQRLGIRVETLDAQALAFGDLSKYDAIVVGVRAYELRPELPGANQRLLDYVSNGGALVVQYNRDSVWDKLQPSPYPAKIGNPTPRITDENSPVKFLQPDDPLLNRPNKIAQDDFRGWVQERGLYFWSQFDPKYTPLLAMNDPGENDLNGALVYTHYGKGTYIYTGIAFFRQLPEGVSGAYRLFVNLLSAARGH